MGLPPFDIAHLDLPDDQLCVRFYALWAVAQAEKLGIPQDRLTPEIAERLRVIALGLNTDSARYAPLEKAMRLAALGELFRAGKLFRELMYEDAVHIKLQNFRRTEVERLAKARKAGGHAAAELRRETTGPLHERIRRRGEALLLSGKKQRDLAGILAKQFNITTRQIRKILEQKEKRN